MSEKLLRFVYSLYHRVFSVAARKKIMPFIEKFVPNASTVVNRTFKKIRFHYVETRITDHCNLDCKYCTALSPVAEEKFMDKASFVRDYTRLRELTGGDVGFIRILGGEPLLHPELLGILTEARKLFCETSIQLFTNGILLSKQSEEFWRTCGELKVFVSISAYPINIHFDSFKQTAEHYGVKIGYNGDKGTGGGGGGGGIGGANPAGKDMFKWHLDLQGSQDKIEQFNCCPIAACSTFDYGKLYACSIAASIKHFNKYFNQNIPITEEDYIDIYKVQSIDEILEFISAPRPICAYCYAQQLTEDLKWGLSKKEITEWT
jgi:hypothetical protein